MKIEEIQSRLTSEDPEVLEQARALITEMLAGETERGNVAEGRAATTLAVICVVAGFGVSAAGTAVNGAMATPAALPNPALGTAETTVWHLVIGYATALAFLIRGAYYCVRTVSPQKYFMVAPDLIFDLQAGSRIEGLRSEIAHKMWQYEREVRPNSRKLYWLTLGQRGLLVGISFLSLTAVLARVHAQDRILVPSLILWVVGVLLAVLVFVLDRILDRLSDWREGRHYKLRA